MSGRIEFRLLGPLEVVRDGSPIPLGGPRQRAVLGHLLIRANHVVATDRLIEEIWGDEPPEAARNALQSYISRLRSVLGDGATIDGVSPGYVLAVDASRIDSSRFEDLAARGRGLVDDDPERAIGLLYEALDEWRGTPFADLDGLLSLAGEVARLEELRLAAIESRIEGELALGRHGEVISELEQLLEEHPFRERLWSHLMIAIYREGRQADALSAYRRVRSLLIEELGLDPSPELQELEGRILRQDPSLAVPGRPLRGYRLLEEIGEGSFGTVHRAMQRHVGREVAVKTVHARWADDPAFIRRFEAEARMVARLEHPRIVPLYDYWREPGSAHLVMRWLRGGNLHETLAERALPVERAVEIVAQVAAGLAAAHRQGVVHRDVKAANILLDEEGNAYLSDFGIASETAQRASVAGTSSSPYLSPEQLRGESPTPRSDIYSLGVVLYEALTGSGSWPSTSGWADTVPEMAPSLRDVIATATALDPAERFADAEAFSVALAETAASGAIEPYGELPNPYKGIRPFDEADAVDFFGREGLVARLVDRLREDRFVALVGASGSGKSSVVNAGLIPALRRGVLEGSGQWFYVVMTPASDPVGSLEAGLAAIAADPVLLGETGSLTDVVNRVLPNDSSQLLLFVDQFEELFAHEVDAATRSRFLDILADAVTSRGRVRLAVALRADFYEGPLSHQGFAEQLRTGTELIVTPSATELEQAVTGPSERLGVTWDRSLVAEIIAEVAGQGSALPSLQHALTELFEQRRGTLVPLEAYRDLGGVSGAVARRAEAHYSAAGETGRETIRQLFLSLVDIDEASRPRRLRVTRRMLHSLDVAEEQLDAAIEAFGVHRLLTFDRDSATREPTVEIAHEALLGAWDRLAGWISEAKVDVQNRRRLASARAEWEAALEDPSFLVRGSRLEHFEEWTASSRVATSSQDLLYLDVARAQRDAERLEHEDALAREAGLERKSRRRLQALAGVLAVASVVAGALSIFAFNQRQTAREEAAEAGRQSRLAISRELAGAAIANLDVDPDLSINLALAAVAQTDAAEPVVREAEEALHTAVMATRVVRRLPASAAVFDPQQRYLAAIGESGVVLFDVTTGDEVGGIDVGGVVAIALGPDGDVVAVATDDGGVTVRNVTSGEMVLSLDAGPAPMTSIGFDPGGTLIGGVTSGDQAVVWDSTTGATMATVQATGAVGMSFGPNGQIAVPSSGGTVILDVHSGEVTTRLEGDGRNAAFSPDGSLLATIGLEGVASIWDARAGERLRSLVGHNGHLDSVAFSDDGELVVTGGHDGKARVWDVRSGAPILALSGQQAPVASVSFSVDGRYVVGAGINGTLVWDISPAGSVNLVTIAAHDSPVFNVAYNAAGSRLATAGGDGMARVWDATTSDLLAELVGHEGPVFDVVFRRGDGALATAGFDGTVRLWTEHGAPTVILRGHTAPVWGVAFSPDGRRLATVGEDATGIVWDLATATAIGRLVGHEDSVWDVAWSPDGSSLVTVSNDLTARIWDAEMFSEVATLAGHQDNIVEQAFNPDGTLVATAGFDGARVWDVENAREVMALEGHGGIVLDVEASPDGSRWATGGADRTIRLWDSIEGTEVLTLTGHEGNAARLAFSPDGTRIAAAGDEGLVRVYTLDVYELVNVARERLSRTMTEGECLQYLRRPCE